MRNNREEDYCLVAAVAVEKTVYHFDKLFDYRVPKKLEKSIEKGRRVYVPFGKGNGLRQAMVFSVDKAKASDVENLKEIRRVLDKTAVLTEEMLELALFIKDRCFCTVFEGVKAMLPAGLMFKMKLYYKLSEKGEKLVKSESIEDFSQEEKNILLAIFKSKGLEKEKTADTFGKDAEEVFEKLCREGFVLETEKAKRKTADATVKCMALTDDAFDYEDSLTEKQEAVFEILSMCKGASVKEICYYTGVTTAVADALVKKGIAYYYEEEVFRTPKKVSVNAGLPEKKMTLSEEQNRVFENIYGRFKEDKPSVTLLFGVTGSGKTSVYIKLIDSVLKDGKTVIFMVPEISLTPQFTEKFEKLFGSDVAVFHSRLSLGERLDEYKRVLRGDAKIVVGTRSAVFAPLRNIGLIIMDEEHEHTYKSESTPRYNACQVAKFRCTKNNSLLLLGSATPSVESYYHALNGTYSLEVLKERYGTSVLPDVMIEDMNLQTAEGNFGNFSSGLALEIEKNLENGKQSILLLNRRGHNTFVACTRCKEVVTCPNCSISLTFHSANNRLMCHYCGYSIPYTNTCPSCHQEGLRFSGAGTQRVEQELAELFPSARILRLDTDSTMGKYSHERKLSAFAAGDYDILVGTQMVAKGLDFPKVTLVGVINADTMLYSDDFRSYEKTFSLLTQVVGRSGRGEEKGRAVIQTFTPDNPIIYLAAEQNYEAFYQSEIEIRRGMLYPPFADICYIGFVGLNHDAVRRKAMEFSKSLAETARLRYSHIPMRVLGPSPSSVTKVNNKYRYNIIIKCRDNRETRSLITLMLCEFGRTNNRGKGVRIFADMNPLSI